MSMQALTEDRFKQVLCPPHNEPTELGAIEYAIAACPWLGVRADIVLWFTDTVSDSCVQPTKLFFAFQTFP